MADKTIDNLQRRLTSFELLKWRTQLRIEKSISNTLDEFLWRLDNDLCTLDELIFINRYIL